MLAAVKGGGIGVQHGQGAIAAGLLAGSGEGGAGGTALPGAELLRLPGVAGGDKRTGQQYQPEGQPGQQGAQGLRIKQVE